MLAFDTFKIDDVTITILVRSAESGIAFQHCVKQLRSQKLRVCLSDLQRRYKDTSLMTPTRVHGIQAIIEQLIDVNDGVGGAG
jgi:hypothetical protein